MKIKILFIVWSESSTATFRQGAVALNVPCIQVPIFRQCGIALQISKTLNDDNQFGYNKNKIASL